LRSYGAFGAVSGAIPTHVADGEARLRQTWRRRLLWARAESCKSNRVRAGALWRCGRVPPSSTRGPCQSTGRASAGRAMMQRPRQFENRLSPLFKYLFGLNREPKDYFGFVVENLKDLVTEQATEFTL
jgi:hypothetical protein